MRRFFDFVGRFVSLALCAVVVTSLTAASAWAVGPVSEGFDSDASSWGNAASAAPGYSATGGNPDGYITETITLNELTGTIFRGQGNLGSSGSAFVGDWQGSGIHTLSFDIRHNNPDPLSFYTRIATPANFPAHVAESSLLVQPNVWTTVMLDVTEGSLDLTAEFGDYATTFASVGNLQIGTGVADGTPDQLVTFDLDNVVVVPEPGTLGMLLLGLAGLIGYRQLR